MAPAVSEHPGAVASTYEEVLAVSNRKSDAESPTENEEFPGRLRASLARERPLIDALNTLRSLGVEGEQAVEAVSSLRRIKKIKLSWELWESLTEGEGLDPETLLLDEIPVGTLDRARHALFGSWRGDAGSVHLEVV
jgi:hypothetical protein